jgi:hypothetical protein
VKAGEEDLAKAVRLKAAPGEMEKNVVKKDKLAGVQGEITVSLEEIV